MLRKFRAFEATDRCEFRDPDSGYIHRGKNLQELYRNIISYREQNRLEAIDHLDQVVENYLCGLPENCNRCEAVPLKRGFYSYIRGGIALVKRVVFQKFVTQEVAEARARQCVGCKFNYFPDRGPFISWIDDVAVQTVGERKVSLHNELAECQVCLCPLRSKVFFDGKLPKFTEEQLVKLREVNCWQIPLAGQS